MLCISVYLYRFHFHFKCTVVIYITVYWFLKWLQVYHFLVAVPVCPQNLPILCVYQFLISWKPDQRFRRSKMF